MNDCREDIHIDFMHVLYVYSRVMGVIHSIVGGSGTCGILDIYKTHAVQ